MDTTPKPKENTGQPGILGLVWTLLFGSSPIYALNRTIPSETVEDSLIERCIPSIIFFSILSVMTIFRWTKAEDSKYVPTRLEWIPISTLVDPMGYNMLSQHFPQFWFLGGLRGQGSFKGSIACVIGFLAGPGFPGWSVPNQGVPLA